MDEIDRSKIVKRLRKVFLVESIGIVIASVMACGLVEYSASFVAGGGNHAYDPIFMIGMIGPMALVTALISYFSLRATKRPLNRPAAGIALIVAVSMATFALMDYGAYLRLSDSRPYDFVLLLAMLSPMGLIMGLVSYLGRKKMRRSMVRSISEVRRQSATRPTSFVAETDDKPKKSKIAKELKKRLLFGSTGIVLASVMTFGLVNFIVNIVMGENRLYHPVNMIGMIGPMGLIMGLFSYITLRATTRSTSHLILAIEKVAKGKFGVRLREDKAGSFREVFSNFNGMCEELQGIQTLRDDFINHFSHEFKTPLTSINGFAKLLLEESVSDEERAQYLRIIALESERLAEMSNNALMMTKLESQHFIVAKETYALDEQIKRCAILLSPQWVEKGIDLSADLEHVSYTGNANLMQQVWINLLGNAIKFTPDHGKISLGLKKSRNALIVTVSDTGKGMREEDLARVFEKYYQGDSFGKSKGLGLGLAIAKRIVELAGGRIEARSLLGEGSTFTVYLP